MFIIVDQEEVTNHKLEFFSILTSFSSSENRETTPSKLRTESIVDRIKNSLSPAPNRHSIGQ